MEDVRDDKCNSNGLRGIYICSLYSIKERKLAVSAMQPRRVMVSSRQFTLRLTYDKVGRVIYELRLVMTPSTVVAIVVTGMLLFYDSRTVSFSKRLDVRQHFRFPTRGIKRISTFRILRGVGCMLFRIGMISQPFGK